MWRAAENSRSSQYIKDPKEEAMMQRRGVLLGRWLTVAGTAVFLISLSSVRGPLAADDQGKDKEKNNGANYVKTRVEMGLELAPVPLTLNGKDKTLVGLGSYIVNAVTSCNDCHTNPAYSVGGNPHLGQPKVINASHYLAGGRSFGPGLVSRNLTPDGSGKPAGLSLEEFIHVIRTGEDRLHALPNTPSVTLDLLQVMPWPVYQEMTDYDLTAIYEYLRAIPHAEPGP